MAWEKDWATTTPPRSHKDDYPEWPVLSTEHFRKAIDGDPKALYRAFAWDCSEEGFMYWSDLCISHDPLSDSVKQNLESMWVEWCLRK